MNTVSAKDIEQRVKDVAQSWSQAELQGDTRFLEDTLTADFVGVGPRGFMLTKTDWLQRITSGSLKYLGFQWDEVSVRVYEDSALVIGRSTQKLKYQDQMMENALRTTLALVNQQGNWHIAGVQFSPTRAGLKGNQVSSWIWD